MANNLTCEFFRDLYRGDFDRRDKHDAADSFLLAIATLLGTIGIYCLKYVPSGLAWAVTPNAACAFIAGFVFCRHKRFRLFDFAWLGIASTAPTMVVYLLNKGIVSSAGFREMCFVALYGAFLGFFVMSIISILGSVWPREIAYISEPATLNAWLVNLQPFYGYGNQDREQIAEMEERELNDEMRSQYVRCSQVNREHNLIKQKWQSTGRTAMALAVSAIMLNGLPVYYQQLDRQAVQAVEIIKLPPLQLSPKSIGDSPNVERKWKADDHEGNGPVEETGASKDRGTEAKSGSSQ